MVTMVRTSNRVVSHGTATSSRSCCCRRGRQNKLPLPNAAHIHLVTKLPFSTSSSGSRTPFRSTMFILLQLCLWLWETILRATRLYLSTRREHKTKPLQSRSKYQKQQLQPIYITYSILPPLIFKGAGIDIGMMDDYEIEMHSSWSDFSTLFFHCFVDIDVPSSLFFAGRSCLPHSIHVHPPHLCNCVPHKSID